MAVLGIDTSNKSMGIVLSSKGRLVGEHVSAEQKNHSVTLMPAIDFVMQEAKLLPKDLKKVVVAKGPGSYTGLRIAVTTGKTLAWTLGIPLYAVSSLKILAKGVNQQLAKEALIIPLMDARRNNVYAGGYRYELGHLNSVIPDKHCSIDGLINELNNYNLPLIFVGEDTETFRKSILEAYPEATIINEPLIPRALMNVVTESDLVSDIESFVPDYLKRVEAEEKWLETHEIGSTDYVKRV
ncbi:tRNA (adenosine(37)-N6)-threonylcarbamoyltransferase complex dimerization subunit type 1 TsaB [Vagococcus vulneris]|uniref:tRNA (Adenosine(37)-N6)-threonylcarbamoyltransferase complex dimerization subunit type 1 TsaB n=1 Tax=Vagococcus vulneris TaxID=1977869 RepID=A0A430A103_9ENTE|nr:tRNA (adenosine(37)-N6)-threonylcarbamoyltransferase complex dimerization subunit type 1 TsaB [Vagococcus vulneris]RSU00076.1 tRNA (adenosine(37)-N6)-threonylcarbamoyltransferase complex dimerization subunit type 1 TsaB [Vagococcus vulneris]